MHVPVSAASLAAMFLVACTGDTGDTGDTDDDGTGDIATDTEDVVINEWIRRVEQDGEDWIELYNRGTSAVDLAGWTVDDDGPDRFTFPAGAEIEAGGFVLLASLESEVSAEYRYPFRIGDDPYIQLQNAASMLIDRADIDSTNPLPPNIARARMPDGGDEWVVTPNLTPGATNVPD